MSEEMDTPYATKRRVDPVRVWAGGVATALVAAGVAVVGIYVIQALLRIPQVRDLGADRFYVDRLTLAVSAAAAALLATGLLHLLMVSTPRAQRFFGWIVTLFVVALIVQELLSGDWPTSLYLAALYLVIGIAIGSLLTGVGRSAVKYIPVRPLPPGVPPGGDPQVGDSADRGYLDDEAGRGYPPR
ncbi:MAG: hypothetical protein J2P23_06250 [Microlunatus sp.]|nr:hypothetical protein [Microlunatus sp.]